MTVVRLNNAGDNIDLDVYLHKTGFIMDRSIVFINGNNMYSGKQGEYCWVFDQRDRIKKLFIGVGDGKVEHYRDAVCIFVDSANENKFKKINIHFYDHDNLIFELTKISILANYRFDHYIRNPINTLMMIYLHPLQTSKSNQRINRMISRGIIYAESTISARNMANERADIMNPDEIENICYNLKKKYGNPNNLNVYIYKENELMNFGMNLFIAVGQGSKYESRMIVLEYNGNNESKEYTAIVGKGITFDSGGMNIKLNGNMDDMHLDKGGAAAVFGTLEGIIRLKLKINVVGIMCIAENAISQNSFKPCSIIRSMKGDTVKITNTDAEGRLLLADALWWVDKNYICNRIIDIATLTSSCIHALGETIAGIFGNNQPMIDDLIGSGNNVGEKCWMLPLLDEYIDDLKCDDADISLTGIRGRLNKGSESSIAATFLSNFVKNKNWVHIDMAGPGFTSVRRKWMNKGGTGFGVQLLLDYLQK